MFFRFLGFLHFLGFRGNVKNWRFSLGVRCLDDWLDIKVNEEQVSS